MEKKRSSRYCPETNAVVPRYTFKEIFDDHWETFMQAMLATGKTIRPVIHEEVRKIINCQNPKMGTAVYLCGKCDRIKHVPFTCKSRFCNTCGVKYSENRAINMSSTLMNADHRHVVFTIPRELRRIFAHDRNLLNLLFKSASEAIFFYFANRNKSLDYTPGFISVLHTFGRDLKWNPHIHMVLCTEAVDKFGNWKAFPHIHYESMRKSWQFTLLKNLREVFPTPQFKLLVDALYKNNKNGFYVYAPPVKNFSSGAVNYILRYAGRPVMAQSRIKNYDGNTVTFTYTPHDSDQLVTETVSAHEFIARLIIHIPDREFKMIRYYGFYSSASKKRKWARRREPWLFAAEVRRAKDNQFWYRKIWIAFHYDPLKCPCGGHFELMYFYHPPPYKNLLPLLPDTSRDMKVITYTLRA